MNSKDEASLAPVFRPFQTSNTTDAAPSSSPAFGTPVYPINAQVSKAQSKPVILPVLLPPASLRPLAFRTFTKKHDLTLTSSALQALANFIGKHCGAGWREEGLAELVLEEVAKTWKRNGGGVIVEGNGEDFKTILKNISGCMLGGKIVQSKSMGRQSSFTFDAGEEEDIGSRGRPEVGREDSQTSLGFAGLAVVDRAEDDDEEEEQSRDPRTWLKVIGAFQQPRIVYSVGKKHFERENGKPSLFPSAAQKTRLFQNRYNIVHQRVLRNESFQRPTISGAGVPSLQRTSSTLATPQRFYKITSIANLLGRSGTSHLLLGLLAVAPTGTLAISDPTGSITLDLQQAKAVPEDGAWFAPGMIVLVDGVYEEEYNSAGGVLGNSGGIGGTIGGRFVGLSIGGPPCERREVTLGLSGLDGAGHFSSGGGFGWTDFLGVGSERALGSKMRRLEERIFRRGSLAEPIEGRERMAILGEVNLDSPRTLEALRHVLEEYASSPSDQTPMAFILAGNFVKYPALAGGRGGGGSVEYKECFNSLAAILSEFPSLLQRSSFVFVASDNDPWASAFSAGASTMLPRKPVPGLFTSRIKRAFSAANAEAERATGKKSDGKAIWTSNPSRLTLFGPSQEIVLFRDDLSARLRRNAIRFRGGPSGESDNLEVRANGELQKGTRHEVITSDDNSAAECPLDPMDIDTTVQSAESVIPTTTTTTTTTSDHPNPPPEDIISHDTHTARKVVKTILDQGHLSPFPLSTRPVSWDHATPLQLYPLPTALALIDPDLPAFSLTYEGCHVMNPGPLLLPPAVTRHRDRVRWVEYDARRRRGRVRELFLLMGKGMGMGRGRGRGVEGI